VSRPLLIGHRGAGGLAPENTLPAFARALKEGVDFVECDVRASRDGEVMVFHDEELQRLTGVPGLRLRDLSASEIREQLRVHKREPIPTLRELCAFLASHPFKGLFVEVKEPEITGRTLDILTAYGKHFAAGALVVGGFSQEVVREVLRVGSRFRAIQLATDDEDWSDAWWKEPQFSLAGLPIRSTNPERVQWLRERGVDTWIWTVNTPEEFKKFATLSAEGVISDFPDRAASLLDQQAGGISARML